MLLELKACRLLSQLCVYLLLNFVVTLFVSQVIPLASEEQLLLVELVRSVSAMRTETVMQTVKEVLKQPPAIAKDKVGV